MRTAFHDVCKCKVHAYLQLKVNKNKSFVCRLSCLTYFINQFERKTLQSHVGFFLWFFFFSLERHIMHLWSSWRVNTTI